MNHAGVETFLFETVAFSRDRDAWLDAAGSLAILETSSARTTVEALHWLRYSVACFQKAYPANAHYLLTAHV